MTMTMSAYQHVKTGKKIFGGHYLKRNGQIKSIKQKVFLNNQYGSLFKHV